MPRMARASALSAYCRRDRGSRYRATLSETSLNFGGGRRGAGAFRRSHLVSLSSGSPSSWRVLARSCFSLNLVFAGKGFALVRGRAHSPARVGEHRLCSQGRPRPGSRSELT